MPDPVPKIPPDERKTCIASLDGWPFDAERDGIRKSCRFADFVEALGFMTRVALLAERADHHSSWANVYNRVNILLTTHDANGVSMRDLDLARSIDQMTAV
jgi:4a-hydroxytetrahydrobiopterin dehydratase